MVWLAGGLGGAAAEEGEVEEGGGGGVMSSTEGLREGFRARGEERPLGMGLLGGVSGVITRPSSSSSSSVVNGI